MISRGLRAGASGIGVALWRGQEGGGENGGNVFIRACTPGRLCGARGHRGMQTRADDA